ncbi:hypothetical protein EYB26_009337 [Talaromyces marneffei]|nr:uncharacterized protein EYB26_009337 [Talaromyces marneffei]QGA21626.1 hypothetical protein EYB26_009337 [Talaromyces marneffei]
MLYRKTFLEVTLKHWKIESKSWILNWLYIQSPIPHTLQNDGISPVSIGARYKPMHVLMPGPRQDLYLDVSFPSRITNVTFEVLLQSQNLVEIPNFSDVESVIPEILQSDRSLITPSIVRHLLARYDRCIRPQYDSLALEVPSYDGANLKKVPADQKFKILTACAIAAACESYTAPIWKSIAHICREWANEYTTSILSAADRESLTSTLLLLIYELADPSRGATWELLDLAVRTCLQLGWHRTGQGQQTSPPSIDGTISANTISCGPDDVQLMSVIKNIDGSLRTTFNRPNMLNGSQLPTASDTEYILSTYVRLSHEIYDTDQYYENDACPFTGEISLLIGVMEGFQDQQPMVLETWLLFLAVCVRHKQCVFCFQEADEPIARGMRSLRHQVVVAASQLISTVYELAIARDGSVGCKIRNESTIPSSKAVSNEELDEGEDSVGEDDDLPPVVISGRPPGWNMADYMNGEYDEENRLLRDTPLSESTPFNSLDIELAATNLYNAKEDFKKLSAKRRIKVAEHALREAREDISIVNTSDIQDEFNHEIGQRDYSIGVDLRVYINKRKVISQTLHDMTRRSFDLGVVEDQFYEQINKYTGNESFTFETCTAFVKSMSGRGRQLSHQFDDFSLTETLKVLDLINNKREAHPGTALYVLFEVKVACEALTSAKKKIVILTPQQPQNPVSIPSSPPTAPA